jgi:hypothetical protein
VSERADLEDTRETRSWKEDQGAVWKITILRDDFEQSLDGLFE